MAGHPLTLSLLYASRTPDKSSPSLSWPERLVNTPRQLKRRQATEMANWKSACILSMTTGPVVYHQGNRSGPFDWDIANICGSLQLGRRLVSKMMPWYISQLPRAVPEPTKKTTCPSFRAARPGIRTQRSLHLFWRCAGAFQPQRQGVIRDATASVFLQRSSSKNAIMKQHLKRQRHAWHAVRRRKSMLSPRV